MRGGDSTPLFPRNFSATIQMRTVPAPKGFFLTESLKQEDVVVNKHAAHRIRKMHADFMERDAAA